jgi:hypothetical protein
LNDQAITEEITRGQALEIAGDRMAARAHYEAIWAAATRAGDAYRACIAAHFLAHAHTAPDAQRDWHERALRAAESANAAGDTRVCGFYPSLYANLAEVCLRLGERTPARAYLDKAQASAAVLSDDGYGRMMHGLMDRLTRTLADDH